MKLINELLSEGKIKEDQAKNLQLDTERSGKTEEELILEQKIMPEDSLFEFKSSVLKIPFRKVKAEDVPSEVLELVSEEAATNYKMVPLAKNNSEIEIGMIYPEDIPAQNALRFLSRQENFNYKVSLISISGFNELLAQYRTIKGEVKKSLKELKKKEKFSPIEDIEEKLKEKTLAEDAPIIKIVLVILKHAIEGNASDIHIEPGREKLVVRFRQDGVLYPNLFLPLSVHASIIARIKIISGLKIDENRIPQDGRFSANIAGKDIDFRVASFPTIYGEKIVIRILDPSAGLKSFEKLGLREESFNLIKEAIKKPYGLILSTGPTGSGKTTTLYALLRILNQEGTNIVTLEDPVEYSVAGINQSQVKPEIGYSFASGLRQILRQDPNVIMVGEIRDEETVDLAINASLTGHIVLSTLHTNSAIGAIPRIIDMGIKPFLIPSALKVVISQRLIRLLCDNCKTKVKPSEKVRNYILEKLKNIPVSVKKEFDVSSQFSIFEAKGCEKCGGKGYIGRVGLYEVFSMNSELASLIVKDPIESSILKLAQKQGMLTMAQEGILKVLNGKTTIQEVTRVTEENY